MAVVSRELDEIHLHILWKIFIEFWTSSNRQKETQTPHHKERKRLYRSIKHHLLKGCAAGGNELDQSVDSRDSESVTGEPSKDGGTIDDQKQDDDLEIDDDEEGAAELSQQ